jgi:hypothetical protein
LHSIKTIIWIHLFEHGDLRYVKFVGNKTHGTLDSGRIEEFLHETTSTSTDRRFLLKETFASDLSVFPRLAAGTPGD